MLLALLQMHSERSRGRTRLQSQTLTVLIARQAACLGLPGPVGTAALHHHTGFMGSLPGQAPPADKAPEDARMKGSPRVASADVVCDYLCTGVHVLPSRPELRVSCRKSFPCLVRAVCMHHSRGCNGATGSRALNSTGRARLRRLHAARRQHQEMQQAGGCTGVRR